MKSGAQKRKEKAQQQFQSCAAVQKSERRFFAFSITPTNINFAEKACNTLLVIIHLQNKVFCLYGCKFIEYFVKNDII